MFKKHEYYTPVYGRTNDTRRAFMGFFYGISSYPRLLIEVFLRRDMGIRYFNFAHCIRMAVVLSMLPLQLGISQGYSWYQVLLENWGWYLFIGAFLKCSWDRYKECKRPEGYFDFNHFSESSGNRLHQVNNFKFGGKLLSVQSRDVYLEPALATAAGFIAFLVGQGSLGMLLTVCAGIYSLSYKAAYDIGRNYILDCIDKAILSRDLNNTFLNDKPAASNFQFYGPKPSSDEVRNGLANLFAGEDEGTEVS